jgi:hypothetical protein
VDTRRESTLRPRPRHASGGAVPWLVSAAGAVALLALVLAFHPSSVRPAPAAAPASPAPLAGAPYAVGRWGKWEYTVLEARRMQEIKGRFSTATAKGEYVVVGLQLKNVGPESLGLDRRDFELYDAAGVKYTSTPIYVAGWEQALGYDGEVGADTDALPPGVAGKYLIAFDVAPGSQGLTLRLVQAQTDVPLP